jgi:hypothetical protein
VGCAILHETHCKTAQDCTPNARANLKESNRLEEVEAGLIHSAESVYTIYTDPRRDEWNATVRPALGNVSLRTFERMTGKSRRMLIDARKGRRNPHAEHRRLLKAVVRKLGLV